MKEGAVKVDRSPVKVAIDFKKLPWVSLAGHRKVERRTCDNQVLLLTVDDPSVMLLDARDQSAAFPDVSGAEDQSRRQGIAVESGASHFTWPASSGDPDPPRAWLVSRCLLLLRVPETLESADIIDWQGRVYSYHQ